MRSLFKIPFLLFFISYTINISAQITITLDSITGVNVTGSQIIIDTIPTNSISLPYIYITNNTGASKDWLIVRKNISQPNDWFNKLCWGGICYGISTLRVWSSNSSVVNNAESEELTIYVGAPTAGNAHYRYYISTDDLNFSDSVDVIINVTSTVGTQNLVANDIVLYPNPAQDKINIIDYTNFSYNLLVYDYCGRQVIYQENSISNEIDLSSLTNGNYLFVLKDNRTSHSIIQQVIIVK